MKLFFNKLFSILTKKDKKYLLLLLLFSILISMIEMIGIAAIMPFISVASNFSVIHSNRYYAFIYESLFFQNDISFVIVFGLILAFFYIFRSAINLLYFYMLSRFSKGRYHVLAYKLLENYLGRDYKSFQQNNSSNLSKTIITEVENITDIFLSFLFIVSEIFVVILIYSMMLYINWKITLLLSLLLFINAIFLTNTISKKIKKAGKKRETSQKEFYEVLNSTFGNFKMIKLKSNDNQILEKFSNASLIFTKSNITNQTLTQIPRLFLEAIGFLIVILIVIYLVYKYQQDISSAMALISMFILGLYRLMPSMNRILSSYNQILFNYKSMEIIHNDIIYEIEDLGDNNILFMNSIEMKNIYFSYENNKDILKNISLTITKGAKVAFIGESGSGKSTLVDIIMGLYRPNKGSIYIDETHLNNKNIKNWRKHIGYIPQHTYLFDGTVGENVAFGEVYDENKIKKALKSANLLEFLETNHYGIYTKVGENGLKLSGGQKQRVAIARALYSDPEILILDEATSALDTATEKKIMDEIYKIGTNKTLIIIAHRLSTIIGCDKVYTLEKGILI